MLLRSKERTGGRRILITRLTAMGDVAMTAPIVASVCRANPDVEFHLLSTSFFEPFFETLPNFRFIGTDIRKEKGTMSPLWRLFCTLRSNGYTDVVDLHNVLRTQVLRTLFRLCGCHVVYLHKGRIDKHRLTNGSCRRQLTPMTERYARLFRRAGLATPDERYLRSSQAVPDAAPRKEKGGERWIGVSPFAQHRGKRYPIERMTQVLDGLLVYENVRVFLFGGGGKEKEQASELCEGRRRCHNMIGVCGLKDEMALMSNLDCMLSMDSSAMHICSIFGTRVVSIWGATHPYAGFLGYGQRETDVVQRNDLDCRPCSVYGNKPCRYGDYRCMEIDAQEIVRRIME